MKAGNLHKTILTDPDGMAWALALGSDAKAEHTGHRCEPLLRRLGVTPGAEIVADMCCAPQAPARDWILVDPDSPRHATLLVFGDIFARDYRFKKNWVPESDVVDCEPGYGFFGAEQGSNRLVTAWDEAAFALAAFRPEDRQVVRDVAQALGDGRLAVAHVRMNGPVLVLADRAPPDLPFSAVVDAVRVAERGRTSMRGLLRRIYVPEPLTSPAP